MKVIEVNNLSKSYRIGARREAYFSIREDISDFLKNPFQWLRDYRASRENFWALKDVSFSVEEGEVLGIIGLNGAGKSTLLKILSRITPPTEGEAIIKGRVRSLLEVGTGFHPELTGRENIYLNGAILGMTKKEIESKFNEIIEFSEIGKFLDTPVKKYSSGMYVRLAFSVAAHLEPEILIIDEVLAVGDTAFQKKCLKRMEGVAKGGRTVLFVSHNMSAISSLCSRAILLRQGKVAAQGPASQVVNEYLSTEGDSSSQISWSFEDAPGSELMKFKSIKALNKQGEVSLNIEINEPCDIEIEFWCLKKTKITPSLHLYNQFGVLLFYTMNLHDKNWGRKEYEPGLYKCSCRMPANLFNEGTYYVNAYLSRDVGQPADAVKEPAVFFRIYEEYSADRTMYMPGQYLGAIRPLLSWNIDYQGPLG